ncbi:uncharacterized protein [Ptychodera flava]|uniref:uncharacterized protein isoform X2 n=1 Tax=Ptychodera flava TaxID=63121 RepID=UPI003969DE03
MSVLMLYKPCQCKAIHQDAGQWLAEPLTAIQSLTESDTRMATYRRGSSSSLHMADMNSATDYQGGLSTASYHSTSNVRDPRRQPYFGYQPSSITTSQDDVSELFLIPGQDSLMQLPAQSRFSYAYGETALQKYGYDETKQYDHLEHSRSPHRSPNNSPGSRYSYAEPRVSQYTHVEPPRSHYTESLDRSFDSSNYGSSAYADDHYSTDGRTDGIREEYSRATNLETLKRRPSESQLMYHPVPSESHGYTRSGGRQNRSYRKSPEESHGRVSGYADVDDRNLYTEPYSQSYHRDVAGTYGDVTDSRTTRSGGHVVEDQTDSYRSRYGLTSDTALRGDVPDGNSHGKSTPHFSSHNSTVGSKVQSYGNHQVHTGPTPSKYDYSHMHSDTNGYQQQYGIDYSTRGNTLTSRVTDSQQTSPKYVAPPAYRKHEPSTRSHVSSDHQIRDSTSFRDSLSRSNDQDYKPYSQHQYHSESHAWRGYSPPPVRTTDINDSMSSPSSHFNSSGISRGKSQYSTTTSEQSPKEQTWTYSGALVPEYQDREMKSVPYQSDNIPQYTGTPSLSGVNNTSTRQREDFTQKSRLSSYGVKIDGDFPQRSYSSRSVSPSLPLDQDLTANTPSAFKRQTPNMDLSERKTSPFHNLTEPMRTLSDTASYIPPYTGSVTTQNGECKTHDDAKTDPLETLYGEEISRTNALSDSLRAQHRAFSSYTQTSPQGFEDIAYNRRPFVTKSALNVYNGENTNTSYVRKSLLDSREDRYKSHTHTQTSPEGSSNGGIKSSPLRSSLRGSRSSSPQPPGTPRSSTSSENHPLRKSSHVKFETDEKENIHDHYPKSYHGNSLHSSYDAKEHFSSIHSNSPRGLRLSDLQPNQEIGSQEGRESNVRLDGRNTRRHSSSSMSGSLKQTNVPLSPPKLSFGRSQSLERLCDGKSSESSYGSRPLSSSMKMATSASREISASTLQQFRKRISKSQVQTNVPIYTSAFVSKSGSHGNKPMKTPSISSISMSPSASSVPSSMSLPTRRSLKTSSRMSSALWAMKLIELLHSNPASCHEELVVKARWFRKWYTNVRIIKRLKIEENQKLEQAADFWRKKMLSKCLSRWKNEISSKLLAADTLYQRHMLAKGLAGLKYAVSQRVQQSESLAEQQKNRMLLRHFETWRNTFQEQRHETLRHAFLTWQQLKVDAVKCKELADKADRRRVTGAFISWRERHNTTQKDGLAGLHYKVNLLSKGLQHWKLYTAERRVKTTQNEMARVYYGEKTVAKFFRLWKIEFQKHQIAENHHSEHLLALTFSGWRRSMSVLRAERLHDISAAKEFHRNALLKIYFVQWNTKLKETMMKKLMDKNRLKHFFEVWYLKQQRISLQRQIQESMARKTMKRQVIYTWLVNVRKQKERREKFIALLERIHLRQALNDWRHFTRFKNQLREKMQDYQAVKEKRQLCRCYLRWQEMFRVRLEEQRARQMWSEQCALKAYDCWKEFVRRRRLEHTLAETQPIRDLNIMRNAFMIWLKAKQQADWDQQKAESVQLILEHNCVHRILTEWRILAKQSKTIQPMVERSNRKLVLRVFDAWRAVIQRKHQGQHQYAHHQHQQLNGAFMEWKKKAEVLQREKEIAQEILENKLRRCMQGWHDVAQRTVQCNMFQEQTDHSKLQQSFNKWRESWEDLVEKRDDEQAQHAQDHILRSVFMKRWQESLTNQKTKTDECIKSFGEYQNLNSMKSAFFNWKKQYISNQMAKEYHDDLQTRLMSRIMQSWNEHTKQSFQESVDKFMLTLGGPSSPSLSLDSSLSQSSTSQISEAMSQNSSGFHSNVPLPSSASSNNSNHGVNLDGNGILPEEPYRWEDIKIFPKASSRARSDSFPSLYSDSLHVEVPQYKQAMLRRVILHWKLWPASTAFQQWLEYTRKQKLLRQLRYKMEYTCIILTLKQGWMSWKRHYMASVTAKRHWETKQKEKCFHAWLYYKIDRKRKTHKAVIADRHANSGMLTRAFIVWRQRTAERRQMIGIVENWQDYVSENVRMEGMARRMRHQIAARTLKECFSIWKMRSQQVERVIEYHKQVLLRKTFIGWFVVARETAERRSKMVEFQENRCKRMAFYLWQLRLSQKEAVEYRYQIVMENRMREIIQRWHCWAIQNHMRTSLCRDLRSVFDIRRLQHTWRVWRQETHRIQKMKIIYQTNLTSKCLIAWHQEVKRRKENQQKCDEFRQLMMHRSLAVAFQRWCDVHQDNQIANEFRQRSEVMMLRQAFSDWWNYTLEERSHKHFSRNILQKCFTTWKEHICRQKRLKRKMKGVVEHWREWTQRGLQLEYVGRQYCVQCKNQQLQSAFRKWLENYEKSTMGRDFYQNSLQRRCFRAWMEVILRKVTLRKMQEDFMEKAAIRQMANMFERWKNEYMLAETRTEMVDLHTYRRDRRLLHSVMVEWRQQTRESKADRYMHTLLLKRTWSRWVTAYQNNRKADEYATNKQTKKLVACMTFWCQWAKGNKTRRESCEIIGRVQDKQTLHRVFLYWKVETGKRQLARQHYEKTLQQKMIRDWIKNVNTEKRLALTEKLVRLKRERRILRAFFREWKCEFEYRLRIKNLLSHAVEKRKHKHIAKCFSQWRKEIMQQKAQRHYRHLLEKRVIKQWKSFTKKRKDEVQHERDMEDLADYHYNKNLCKKTLLSWQKEIKMIKFVKSKQQKKLQECWTTWKSSAERQFTAKQIANHKLYNLMWSKWRKLFIQVRVSKAMTLQDNKHLGSEAFNGWRQYTAVHHLGNQVAETHQLRQLKLTFDLWKEKYNSHNSSGTLTSYSSAPGNLSSSSSETLSVTWN